MKKKLLVAIYGHPESYPPTLNAVSCLAHDFRVKVVHRAHQPSGWVYPQEVELIPDGAVLSARAQEQLPIWRKVLLFLRYTWILRQNIRQFKPEVILLYDSLSVLSYNLIQKISNHKPILWYHNHDVFDPAQIRKYSLSWWAIQAEKRLFPQLAIFSLPAQERKVYFQMQRLGGQYFFLPNYPSRQFYQQFYQRKLPTPEIKLLFQGQVGPGHSIEEIIRLMPLKIHGIPLKLVLKGVFREGYDQWLQTQILEKNLDAAIELHGFTPYAEVPRLGAQCHIGLAVFTKTDLMNQSLGTASNKIYEYAAMGLPILYYDSPHFRAHLSQYKWAIATDLSPESLILALQKIVEQYAVLSSVAHQDFTEKLNFEYHFSFIQAYLQSRLESSTDN